MDVKAPSGSPKGGESNAQPSRKQNSENNRGHYETRVRCAGGPIDQSEGICAKDLTESRTIKTHGNVTP